MSDNSYLTSNEKEKSSNGVLILIFGILGMVTCLPFGIAAWVMGNKERKLYPQDDTVKAGWILGIIATCLFIFSFLILIIFMAVYFFIIFRTTGG